MLFVLLTSTFERLYLVRKIIIIIIIIKRRRSISLIVKLTKYLSLSLSLMCTPKWKDYPMILIKIFKHNFFNILYSITYTNYYLIIRDMNHIKERKKYIINAYQAVQWASTWIVWYRHTY